MEERDLVVLVDRYGRDIVNSDGTVHTMDKMQAHQGGLLHRAISVFVFNHRDELLLQKRASGKYHSPNKWTNTCCTHPRLGEAPFTAAQRRLREEMGLECILIEAFTFLYYADVGNGIIENEFDHVFVGFSNQDPNPNSVEISDWQWLSTRELKQDLTRNPESYSQWLNHCLNKVIDSISHRTIADELQEK